MNLPRAGINGIKKCSFVFLYVQLVLIFVMWTNTFRSASHWLISIDTPLWTWSARQLWTVWTQSGCESEIYCIGAVKCCVIYRGKTGKTENTAQNNILPHMAIDGVLARRKRADKWCATFWDPVPPDLVALNCQIFKFSGFSTFLEGSFMTKCLQIDPRISPKARGFWLKERSVEIHFEK